MNTLLVQITSDFNIQATHFILKDGLASVEGVERVRKMQILRTGTFTDPRYGKFNITKEMLTEMVKNFSEGVRGVIPALDYRHDSDDIAAGWFKKLYLSEDELWAEIEMTPKGEKILADKEFGYVSADFDTGYTDNESGKKFGCVLLGAGLTNRPVIKRMESVIQLSEKSTEENKGEDMTMSDADKKKMADMEAELGAFKQLSEEYKCSDAKTLKEKFEQLQKENEGLKNKTGESTGELKKLSEQSAASQAELSEIKAKLAKAEKTNEFTKLLSEGKAVEAQRESYLKGDMNEFITKSQPIKLGEQGHAGTGADSTKKSDEDKVLELAEALVKSEKISQKEAISRVLSENKNLKIQ